MIRLLIATTNPNKLREIRSVLANAGLHPVDSDLRAGPLARAGVEVINLSDLPPIEEPEETGQTFEENARLKALYYARHAAAMQAAPVVTVAEDSGLVSLIG